MIIHLTLHAILDMARRALHLSLRGRLSEAMLALNCANRMHARYLADVALSDREGEHRAERMRVLLVRVELQLATEIRRLETREPGRVFERSVGHA